MAHRSFGDAGHLPKRRESGLPADPEGLPRQRAGIPPQMHGRYPDYDVLANADHWDEVTREAVLARVQSPPERSFFDPREAAARAPPPGAASRTPGGPRRSSPSPTSGPPRPPSRGSPCSTWSTPSSPPASSTA